MKWTMTKTMVTIGGAIAVAVAAAIVVKLNYFPAIRDSYFKPDTGQLRRVPANLAVVRPTHFPHASSKICRVEAKGRLTRVSGRDVHLRNVVAEAYDCNPARVVLPAGAPEGGFDFLTTTSTEVRKHLQAVLWKKLGYTAREETRETDVFALKVANPDLPGLTISFASEKPDVHFNNGKLYFQHQPLRTILGGLQEGLNKPVLDKTGLTNCYDFSVVWNGKIEQAMNTGAFELSGVRKVLNRLGLVLEPDTAKLDMLVVQKTR